jgi:3D (Asp-Asp-Asp) domain-containing protein
MGENIFRMIEKIIIFLLLVLIVLIIKDYLILPKIDNYILNKPIAIKKSILDKLQCYDMTATAYTRHIDCISEKLDDGRTATNTKIQEGIVAVNVDLINGKWIVISVLKLGQKIYITTMEDKPIGYFRVEDTGPFKVGDIRGASLKDLEWDKRNCDI